MGDPVHDRLRERVKAAQDAATNALKASSWLCSDGHEHRRPEKFTANRLAEEVERRNPGNDWTSSEVSLGIWELVDKGVVVIDNRWQMSLASEPTRDEESAG